MKIDYKNQKPWRTGAEQCLLDVTGTLLSKLRAVVVATEDQARLSQCTSMWGGWLLRHSCYWQLNASGRGRVIFLQVSNSLLVSCHFPVDGPTAMCIWAALIRLRELKKKKEREYDSWKERWVEDTYAQNTWYTCIQLLNKSLKYWHVHGDVMFLHEHVHTYKQSFLVCFHVTL